MPRTNMAHLLRELAWWPIITSLLSVASAQNAQALDQCSCDITPTLFTITVTTQLPDSYQNVATTSISTSSVYFTTTSTSVVTSPEISPHVSTSLTTLTSTYYTTSTSSVTETSTEVDTFTLYDTVTSGVLVLYTPTTTVTSTYDTFTMRGTYTMIQTISISEVSLTSDTITETDRPTNTETATASTTTIFTTVSALTSTTAYRKRDAVTAADASTFTTNGQVCVRRTYVSTIWPLTLVTSSTSARTSVPYLPTSNPFSSYYHPNSTTLSSSGAGRGGSYSTSSTSICPCPSIMNSTITVTKTEVAGQSSTTVQTIYVSTTTTIIVTSTQLTSSTSTFMSTVYDLTTITGSTVDTSISTYTDYVFSAIITTTTTSVPFEDPFATDTVTVNTTITHNLIDTFRTTTTTIFGTVSTSLTTTTTTDITTTTFTPQESTTTSTVFISTSCVSNTAIPTVVLANPTPIIQGSDYSGGGDYGGGYDDEYYPVTLPFALEFYNQSNTNIYVSINGWIAIVGAGTNAFANGPFPLFQGHDGIEALPDTTVAPYYDDLFIYDGTDQGLYYEIDGTAPSRTITFEWYTSHFEDPTQYYHFLASFPESGNEVTYTYVDVSDSGVSATVGAQSLTDGSIWSQYSYDQTVITPGLVLRFDGSTNTFVQAAAGCLQ